MAGLSPWNAPRPASASQGAQLLAVISIASPRIKHSREAVGIRRAVASLQPDLMREMALRPLDEEFRVEGDAALRIGIELHHPAIEAVVIDLLVDGAVERVGEVDPPPVPADLDHLRPAREM